MKVTNVAQVDVTLVYVENDAFETIEMHEMVNVDGLMLMRQISVLIGPVGGCARR